MNQNLVCDIGNCRTEARIYLSHFEHNIQEIRKITTSKICVALKANAYGHGAVVIGKTAERLGVEYVSVATVEEGIELRQAGITLPILLLGVCLNNEIDALIENNLIPLVADIKYVELLSHTAEKMGKNNYPVHIKIDTGMSRHGVLEDDALELAKNILLTTSLTLNGCCTHFAVSDSLDCEDMAFTKKQIACFNRVIENLRTSGINPGLLHCAASGGLLLHPEAHFDMVRPGILCYGYYPDASLDLYFKENPCHNFKPVMELVTHVTAFKRIKAGDTVSYGRKWTAEYDANIASLCIGYADGFNRLLSNNISVTINDERYPIIGRICMDQCLILLADDISFTRWTEAIIFGPGKHCNTAMDIATILDTIVYEVLCLIAPRVKRIYL